MKLNRNYVTPFISLVFLFVAISGVLMLFHLFDGYTEVLHEILGLFFVLCAVLHIILNWSALKKHFKRGVLLPATIAIVLISALLVLQQQFYPQIDTMLIERISKASVEKAFEALQLDYFETVEKLEAKGILVSRARSVEDLWLNNDTDARTVLNLILEE
jgi:amino acid transporter